MIGVETNVLVYAHRAESTWHAKAVDVVRALAEGQAPWAIPWPCVHEFVAIATHPRVFRPPTPLARAIEQVDAWLESPSVVLLAETGDYWPRLRRLLLGGAVVGPRVHAARIAAFCQLHGVRELWSADRDFGRFPDLRVRNPFVE